MRERQRESGDEETGKEVEQEEKKKIKKKRLRYGDEKETKFVRLAGYHHHFHPTVRPLPDLGYRNRYW